MQVSFVLSSGAPLAQLNVDFSCSVAHLKPKVIDAILRQYSDPFKPDERLVNAFRTTALEAPHETERFLQSYRPLLYRYRGEKLSDSSPVFAIRTPVCVMRPTDLIVSSIDLDGDVFPTVFNTLEDVQWMIPAPLPIHAPPVIHLLILASTCEHAVCLALREETVRTIRRRIYGPMKIPRKLIRLWYHDQLLNNNQTLEMYGLEHRSKLLAVSAADQLGLGVNASLRKIEFPISAKMPALKYLQLLEPEWCPSHVVEYKQICPVSNDKHFLVASKSNRLITLSLSHQTSTKALITTPYSLHNAKLSIAAQHNLPAEFITLAFATVLDMGKTARDYGMTEGDVLIIKKDAIKQWGIEMKIIGKNMRSLKVITNSSELVGKVKAFLREQRPYFDSSPTLMLGSTILEDNKQLGFYSLPEKCSLYAATKLPTPLEAQLNLGLFHFIPPKAPRTHSTDPQSSLELFDSAQDPNALSPAERRKEYSNWLHGPAYSVTLATPGQLLPVRVHKEATVAVMKAHLRILVKENTFKLVWNGKELEEDQTLEEQGIVQDAILLLKTPKSIRISVQTASGFEVSPVLLDIQSALQTINKAIPMLPDMPPSGRSFVLGKCLVDEDILPSAIDRYELWLTAGKGAEASLQTEEGTVLRVEVNPEDTERTIRSRFEGKRWNREFHLTCGLGSI